MPDLFTPATLDASSYGQTGYGPTKDVSQSVMKPNQTVQKGSLMVFRYTFNKPNHDPYPMVLVTDRDYPVPYRNPTRFDVRGVNLHYLAFNDIRVLLQANCNNVNFSYDTLKQGQYINLTSAFRQYKKSGIRQVKVLDCAFLLNVLASVRSISPSEVEAIRKSVREQISRMTNPMAAATP
jgi:hypothetical protein